MNTKEMIASLSSKADITKTQAEKTLKALIEVILEGLSTDGEVNWHNMGRWKVAQRKARAGVDPQSGKKINIPAKNNSKFKPAKHLKDWVESLPMVDA